MEWPHLLKTAARIGRLKQNNSISCVIVRVLQSETAAVSPLLFRSMVCFFFFLRVLWNANLASRRESNHSFKTAQPLEPTAMLTLWSGVLFQKLMVALIVKNLLLLWKLNCHCPVHMNSVHTLPYCF